jgi:hypothetical protein
MDKLANKKKRSHTCSYENNLGRTKFFLDDSFSNFTGFLNLQQINFFFFTRVSELKGPVVVKDWEKRETLKQISMAKSRIKQDLIKGVAKGQIRSWLCYQMK